MVELQRIVDIDELMRWRVEVIANVFDVEADKGMVEANRRYYGQHIADGSHIAYVALLDDEKVGCGGMCLTDELPSPDNCTGRCAYLMNIYVREPYRRRGIARMIVGRLVEEALSHGCGKIYLETTDMAKTLYLNCGFKQMGNIMKYED